VTTFSRPGGQMTKHCPACRQIKSLGEFHRDHTQANGRSARCKICINGDPRRRKRNRTYQKALRKNAKTTNAEYQRRYRTKNPIIVKAHWTVNHAIRAGRIVAQPCEICGNSKAHAHHDDYSKPLEVRWLCQEHHFALHRS
jgi:hypothetical protein